MFFFFQAEDGIRDVAVTGVQTCALPISMRVYEEFAGRAASEYQVDPAVETKALIALVRSREAASPPDRKSTRLNSSHGYISYAVFCLKKKKKRLPNQCHLRRSDMSLKLI